MDAGVDGFDGVEDVADLGGREVGVVEEVDELIEHNTKGKTYDEMFETMKFDTFLSAEQAVEWGLADKVVEGRG